MKKIMFVTLGIIAGVILENKYGVQEKSIDLVKKGWDWAVKKTEDLKEDVKENIDEIKEKVSE